MPPRISSNRGDTRGGPPTPPPPGGHQGGELRGSQPGGLSSAGPDATPIQITPPSGQPSVNRGRGRGRGRGANRGSPPSAPIPFVSTSITPTTTTTTENPSLPNPSRGQPAANRGRGNGRGRGTNRGGAPGSPPSVTTNPVVTTPITTTETPAATSSQITPVNPSIPSTGQPAASRGHGRGRGRGANRGGAPGSPPSVTTNPVVTTPITTTETPAANSSQITPVNPSIPSTGQPAASRGYGRGRGVNRGATPGSPPSAPPLVSTPITTTTENPSFNSPQGTFRGRGDHRGSGRDSRGGGRGGARGSPADSPGTFRGGPSHAHSRGGLSAGGPPHTPTTTINPDIPDIPDHVTTFGAKRPGFGTGGTKTKVIINAFPATVPDLVIYQYDVVHNDKYPAKFNMELLRALQEAEPNIFTPKVVYDGRKIVFSVHPLQFGPTQAQKFFVSRPGSNGRPPKVYEILFTMVSVINSDLLQRFTKRDLSHNENVSTTLAALNVAVKMEPNQTYPFNKRSFYIPDGKKDIGGGIELWRGIFQSVRPTIGRLIVNIDLSTGMMFKEGSLLSLCMDFFGHGANVSPNEMLTPGRRFRDIERIRLQKFLSGVHVRATSTGDRNRVVRGLSRVGANQLTFETRPGEQMTVAHYFQSLGITLRFPSVICVLVGQTAMLPLEVCTVPGGQFMRKEIPDDKVKDVLDFSTKKPHERLASIKGGLQYLRYSQSEYVRSFGMTIEEDPLSTDARIIKAPKLKYNAASSQPTIEPKDGAWNMLDKKFYEPSKIVRWAVVIYDSARNFPEPAYKEMVRGFLKACGEVGINVENPDPIFKFEDGQGVVNNHLKAAFNHCQNTFKEKLSLIVVVLPNNAGDIYTAVKHFGDITFGIPTQCLKSSAVKRAKSQYWNNVMLKVNVKLGGINVIPDPSSLAAQALFDPANPTIVMGADVMHPPPGVNRPSYTALIGSVDSHTAKYVATSRAQTGRREIINDMKDMVKTILAEYRDYQVKVEKKEFGLNRLIFYRDGVSEAEFKQVLELELPMIQEACEEFGVNPKITLIIVGKRHHIQFFPADGRVDRSGNCSAGTVVDNTVTHPTDHDFYLLSHAGILGTSRPAHYSVLYDDSCFKADALQSLSYSLCHVYAPSTRSVSIPAPVYYADLVCSRSKTHFDPEEHIKFNDAATAVSGATNLEAFREGYMPLHANQQKAMYFA